MSGVMFTSGDNLTGTVFAESELSLVPPPSKVHYGGSTESPTEGKPYIRLTTSAFNGIPTVLPDETFDLAATDFTAGASYEVLIDGVPIKARSPRTAKVRSAPESPRLRFAVTTAWKFARRARTR